MEDNIVVFLGRFHPLVVHLPIGFLLMAGLLQLFSIKNKSLNLNPAIAFTLFWGTLASIGAVAIGWLLSLQGGYDAETLFWHKWLGILVTVLSFLGWLLKTGIIKVQKSVFTWILASIILLVSVSGHLGGSLTHGEEYLMHYAPNFIKNIAGLDSNDKNISLKEIPRDSIKVFPHIIQPIIKDKCSSCHNSNKKEGGLLLTTHKEILDGGDNGSIINIKSPLESEFLNRVTLPKGHKKFMPPRGASLTFGEIQIIEWWMKNGADSISKFSNINDLDKNLVNTLIRDYNLDYNPKPYYEKVKVDALSSEAISELEKNDFVIDFMGENSNMISVTFKGKLISDTQITKLLLAKDQITWLNVSNCTLNDAHLKSISKFIHLTRLNIHSNAITNDGLQELKVLQNINSINLYNNKISNSGLTDIVALQSLRKLYVWKTDITSLEISDILQKTKNLEIIGQLN
jgi:uncharacterized membrane protein